jgi:hypothetical protein
LAALLEIGGSDLIAVAVTVGIGAGSVPTTASRGVCVVGDVVIAGAAPVLQPTKKTLIEMQMAVKVLNILRSP